MKQFLTLIAFYLALTACTSQPQNDWQADGRAYSADLAFSDEITHLAGSQGTPSEAKVTQEFAQYVLADDVINSAEQELVLELLAMKQDDDLLYLYQSQPYANLVMPNSVSRKILKAVLEYVNK